MIMYKIVLLRHGESSWNKLNRFTGWHDVELTENGKKEAQYAAEILKKEKFFFNEAHTSVLKRAINTLWNVMCNLNQTWLPVKKTWRLNERHYGALEGLNKDETMLKYGEKKVIAWRRSFYAIPPKIQKTDIRFPGYDIRYSHLDVKNIPVGESLELTVKRVIPYWKKIILPQLKKNKKILIVAHGNSLRALIQYLKKIDSNNIEKLNIPTAIPIILEFNKELIAQKYYFLT
ncbi:2,3-diphosphoglycerate-dependent phosphoglycerate mutase [Buchnera aphidicola]|uniref:2,3-diphosphoglycerate-dependent phosphoglycerate mutase n=1 Tax=Buchnera aphidicola TaxID=9 RepID=UPI003BEEBED1